MSRYQSQPTVSDADEVVPETLEAVAREGARRLLEEGLAAEIDAFLGRQRYAPGGAQTGYRNGYARQREVAVGTWSLPVRAPRVADLPPDREPFRSRLLPRKRYFGRETQRLFARLYLEGLSSGDFEPAFRELLGDRAPLSASTIIRLKADWQADYERWCARSITERYPYVWADGIYLGAGLEPETSCLLLVVGARADGRKELLAIGLGYRESTESWAELLRDLRQRGLTAPLLAVGDGVLGLWAALRQVFPATRHQRCWNHRILNLLDKLPRRLGPEARRQLRAVWSASTRAECEAQRDAFGEWLRQQGQRTAAETLYRDWEDFVTFYDFPAEHWRHLRTSNVVESIFAGVRLRTRVAKRVRVRENALYLVFKVIGRLEHYWHALHGDPTLFALLLLGDRFVDGIHVSSEPEPEEVPAA